MDKKPRFEDNKVRKFNSTRDWAELPKCILEEISERLPVIDCISFADVCKPWRSIFANFHTRNKNKGLPWLIMSRQNSRRRRSCVSIVENLYLDLEMSEACLWYLWGSCQDWLIMAQYIRGCTPFLKLKLFNPFSKANILLPDAADCYHKMVLSTNPAEFFFMCMLLRQSSSQVAFWVPGAQEWDTYLIDGGPFLDAVCCGKSFYLVTMQYNIVKLNASSISLYNDGSALIEIKYESCVVKMVKRPKLGKVLRYLVESCGEVLLVCRFFGFGAPLQTKSFEIYRFDVSRMAWKKLKNLGDRILVLGKGCSRSFLANELGIKKTNCIYFLNDQFGPWNEWDIDRNQYLGLNTIGKPTLLKGSDETDWGIFSLGDEGNKKFCYNGYRNHWAPMCVTAPLWWYCMPAKH